MAELETKRIDSSEDCLLSLNANNSVGVDDREGKYKFYVYACMCITYLTLKHPFHDAYNKHDC